MNIAQTGMLSQFATNNENPARNPIITGIGRNLVNVIVHLLLHHECDLFINYKIWDFYSKLPCGQRAPPPLLNFNSFLCYS